MTASPGDLYDACEQSAPLGPKWRRGKPVLWLSGPYIQVGRRTWRPRQAQASADGSGTVFGYDARQCSQVAAALLPVLGAHREAAEQLASGAAAVGTPETHSAVPEPVEEA